MFPRRKRLFQRLKYTNDKAHPDMYIRERKGARFTFPYIERHVHMKETMTKRLLRRTIFYRSFHLLFVDIARLLFTYMYLSRCNLKRVSPIVSICVFLRFSNMIRNHFLVIFIYQFLYLYWLCWKNYKIIYNTMVLSVTIFHSFTANNRDY